MTKKATLADPSTWMAVKWHCPKCGHTYVSPVPILGMVHECHANSMAPAKPRNMEPMQEPEIEPGE